MPEIRRECGFEIHAGAVEIVLIDRRTWWLGYGMGLLAVVAGILFVIALLALTGASEIRSEVPEIALWAGAAVLGVASAMLLPVYKRRRELPSDDVKGALIIDRAGGVLRERSADVVAPVKGAHATVRIDWMTRGLMRVVVLTWSGGRRTVYRTGSRQRARLVADLLNEALRA